MRVVKVGGSLIEAARDVMDILRGHEVLIVPGGGPFADAVRQRYMRRELSEEGAHRMAILAMDQYGVLLSGVSGIMTTVDPLEEALPKVLLPSSFLLEKDPFAPSWDVTSDTIACHVAHLRGDDGLLILTDVDGVMVNGEVIKELSIHELEGMGETCVDRALPGYLERYGLKCRVVNGNDRDNIRDVLSGEPVGTLVRRG